VALRGKVADDMLLKREVGDDRQQVMQIKGLVQHSDRILSSSAQRRITRVSASSSTRNET